MLAIKKTLETKIEKENIPEAIRFGFEKADEEFLNKYAIMMGEYDDWFRKDDAFVLRQFNLLLGPILYLALEFVVYTYILVLIESSSYFRLKDYN